MGVRHKVEHPPTLTSAAFIIFVPYCISQETLRWRLPYFSPYVVHSCLFYHSGVTPRRGTCWRFCLTILICYTHMAAYETLNKDTKRYIQEVHVGLKYPLRKFVTICAPGACFISYYVGFPPSAHKSFPLFSPICHYHRTSRSHALHLLELSKT